MASWDEAKAAYQVQKDFLDRKTENPKIESLVDEMNAAIGRYTEAAGITPNGGATNANYATANAKFQELVGYQQSYSNLIKRLSTSLRGLTETTDVQNKLEQIGTLRNEIVNLERELKNVKQDAETSKARQTDVETPRQNISYYQGFSGMIGFTRPIKLFTVPILIGFSLFLLFISGLILREFFLPASGYNLGYGGYGGSEGGIFSFFTDSRFYAVMGGVALVISVVAVLAYSGKLGSKLK
jgi:hypothetical protein